MSSRRMNAPRDRFRQVNHHGSTNTREGGGARVNAQLLQERGASLTRQFCITGERGTPQSDAWQVLFQRRAGVWWRHASGHTNRLKQVSFSH